MERIPLSNITARWRAEDRAAELVVDGKWLADLATGDLDSQRSPFSQQFVPSAVETWLAGYRDPELRANPELQPGELELAVCAVCGDLWCGSVAMWLSRDEDIVRWTGPHWAVPEAEVARLITEHPWPQEPVEEPRRRFRLRDVIQLFRPRGPGKH